MLLAEGEHTLWVGQASAKAANTSRGSDGIASYYLDTLGVSAAERVIVERLYENGSPIDPVVAVVVAATCGILYRDLIGKLNSYPIPELRLPPGNGVRLLDIGCNWGRWSIAAAQNGYRVIGVDPSLAAVLAAQRVAGELGVAANFVCADARHLPFRRDSFEAAFSYSVLQHFSYSNARAALMSIRDVLATGATVLIQMPNAVGVRCLYHQARRRFRAPSGFEVRYWRTRSLLETFSKTFGPSALEVDCFFGLGLQTADRPIMSDSARALIDASEGLRKLSGRIGALAHLADSVYIRSTVRSS